MSEKMVIIQSGETSVDAYASSAAPIEAGGHTLTSAEEALGSMSTKFTLNISNKMPDGAADIY